MGIDSEWKVTVKNKGIAKGLPDNIKGKFITLAKHIEVHGLNNLNKWPGYGKLKGTEKYHCHLKKGNPTYVAVWKVDKANRVVEFEYIGTHEKAPY